MSGFNDTVSNLYSFSFTANSLLKFDLVRIQPQQQTTQYKNEKSEHCAFVNFVPGEQTNNGGRTYNFQNKISLKYGLLELEGLRFVLKNNAETNGQASNPYRKFAKSQGGQKSVSVWQGSQTKEVAGKVVNVRTIFIQAQTNQQKVSLSMTPDQAYAVAESLHQMYLKGTQLEIERMIQAPRLSSGNTNNNYQSNNNNNQQQEGFTAPPPDPPSQQQQQSITNATDQFGSMIDNNPF